MGEREGIRSEAGKLVSGLPSRGGYCTLCFKRSSRVQALQAEVGRQLRGAHRGRLLVDGTGGLGVF